MGLVIPPSHLRQVWITKLPRGLVSLYEARLDTVPTLRIDHREIIEAMFVPVSGLRESDRRVNAYLTAADPSNSNESGPRRFSFHG